MSDTNLPSIKNQAFPIEVSGETLLLFPQKFAFWERTETLFLADCHVGKVAHFRKAGFGLPTQAGMETFGQLQQMLLSVPARRLVLLGDVFHSDVNQDFDRFRQWRKGFPNLHIDLVLGNHDQAGRAHLGNLGVDLHDNLVLAPFYCSHAPESDSPKGFNLCGHLHPGVSLSGKAGQHVKVPCFWKGENHLCFPAFGQFTGSVAVKPKPEDLLFAITQNKIRCLEGRILV